MDWVAGTHSKKTKRKIKHIERDSAHSLISSTAKQVYSWPTYVSSHAQTSRNVERTAEKMKGAREKTRCTHTHTDPRVYKRAEDKIKA